MPAGYNAIAKILRYDYRDDDDIGGASPSGTVLLDSIWCRIEPIEPTMALLEQGLETVKLFRTTLDYNAKNVKENDELVVTAPIGSIYRDKAFRLISIQHSSLRADDPRSHVLVVMRRRDEAHQLTS
jgi:selenophosphate synthase